jgi:hypothetical protein
MNPFDHSEEDAIKTLLEETARQIKPGSAFTAILEKQLKQAHTPKASLNMSTLKKIASPIGWGLALIALAFAFNWIARQIAPKTVPGANGSTAQPAPFSEESTPLATPSTPTGEVYQWNGQPLYLNAALPEAPTEMKIYLAQDEIPASVQDVQMLAQTFGMQGEIYQVQGEIPDTTDYLMVDGDQQLRLRSNRYFTYYPNYAEAMYAFNMQEPADHKTLIDEFMQTHELGSEYKIERSELYGGYLVLPLTPDGFTIHHEHFAASGYLFDFNENGILRVRSSLLRYDEVATAAVISAEEALNKLLDPSSIYGVLSAMHSPNPPLASWRRMYPVDQTLIYYGFLSSTAKSISGGAPYITLDGYTVSGAIQDISENMPNTFMEVTGQFHEAGNVRTFELETWEIYDGYEEGYQGTIQQQGDQTVLITAEGNTLNISGLPGDIALPLEDIFITGITRDGEFHWKNIDTRTMSGGGGGGGGLGFYKVNLSGTPIPLPTHIPLPETPIASELSRFEGERGSFSVNIFNLPDGSQRTEYNLITNDPDYPYLRLEGADLASLQAYHNRPLEIWGAVDHFDERGIPVVQVERFEVPFPDLQFQILKGTQSSVAVEGNTALLFTTEDGQSYVQLTPNCYDIIGPDAMVGMGGASEQLLIEALIVPDLALGGYPTMCVYGTVMAINPKNGLPMELTLTANQPNVIDESIPSPMNPPTASIEKVELAYFTPDKRYYPASEQGDEPPYLQPVWIFSGHYSDGSEFEFIVQALKDEYLSPQVQPARQPG